MQSRDTSRDVPGDYSSYVAERRLGATWGTCIPLTALHLHVSYSCPWVPVATPDTLGDEKPSAQMTDSISRGMTLFVADFAGDDWAMSPYL